jgi:hypothetical protein
MDSQRLTEACEEVCHVLYYTSELLQYNQRIVRPKGPSMEANGLCGVLAPRGIEPSTLQSVNERNLK